MAHNELSHQDLEFATPRKHIYIILTQFYIVNRGFSEVYIIFLISAQNIDCVSDENYFHEIP